MRARSRMVSRRVTIAMITAIVAIITEIVRTTEIAGTTETVRITETAGITQIVRITETVGTTETASITQIVMSATIRHMELTAIREAMQWSRVSSRIEMTGR